MKRFLLSILGFGLLLMIVLSVSLFCVPNNKIPDNSLFASVDKHARLSSVEGPKIVLVGGSNLAFGIKSEMIEDSIGMSVVNMGLHAGLGMQYILSEVKPDIHRGDVVVLSLEYHHFLNPKMFHGEDVLAALLFDVNRDCLRYVSFGQWLAFIPQVCLYSAKKIIDISPAVSDGFAEIFTRDSFNEYGDEVAHYGLPSSVHSGEVPSSYTKISHRSISELYRFDSYVKSRGAQLIMIAPSYPKPQYDLDKVVISAIEQEVQEIGVPYGIKPEDGTYPDSLMFNSFYHLTEIGADMRTQQLIELLKNTIDYDKTEI